MIYYTAMKVSTVLFFRTTSNPPSRNKIAGALRYLDTTDWRVQLVDINLSAKSVKSTLRHWKPIGCIIDRSLSLGRTPVRIMRHIPTVYINQNPQTEVSRNWYVRIDSSTIINAGLAELRRLDPDYFAFARHSLPYFWNRERETVFRTLASECKLDFTILDDDLSLPDRLRALPKPCGLLAANDAVARSVIAAARKANIRMPEDLHIVGIDNDDFICQSTKPTLTSVIPDFERAGYLAMATLHRIVRGTTAAPRITLCGSTSIVRRASTRLLKGSDPRVTRALDYIAANASDPNISTEQIAAVMGCSRSLANLLFHKVTGHTVRERIMEERIEIAKRLLADPNRELSAIPSFCGYRSLPTFARTFKQATGKTMSEWRD